MKAVLNVGWLHIGIRVGFNTQSDIWDNSTLIPAKAKFARRWNVAARMNFVQGNTRSGQNRGIWRYDEGHRLMEQQCALEFLRHANRKQTEGIMATRCIMITAVEVPPRSIESHQEQPDITGLYERRGVGLALSTKYRSDRSPAQKLKYPAWACDVIKLWHLWDNILWD